MDKKLLISLISIVFLVSFIASVSAVIHDADRDGIGSDTDNCPEVYNPLQEDSDNDGVGDLCDNTPGIIIGPPTIINDTSKDKKGIGGGKNAFRILNACYPNWECTAWSECSGGIRTRRCQDTNNCELDYNKPIEQAGCEMSKVLIEEKPGLSGLFILLGIFIIFILIIILTMFLLRKTL